MSGEGVGRGTMRELRRYLLWQVPGWLVTAALAWVAARFLAIPGWTAAVVVALVVAKDLALFPALRQTLRPPADPRPVGARGRVVDALVPTGQVRVRGEIWRATTRDGGRLAAGVAVHVVDARGLLLIVEADEGARAHRPDAASPPGRRSESPPSSRCATPACVAR